MIKVIKNGYVITMNSEKADKIEKLDVVIKDNKIIDICNYDGEYDYLIDATNKIVMPGLINCHTHLGMSIFRATNDSLKLNDWLNNFIWPIEDKLTDEDIYYTTLLSVLEMITTGTTMCNDMYFCSKGSIKALEETKMRILYGRCLQDCDGKGKTRLDEALNIYNENKNSNLIKFSVSPHAMYTCSFNYLKDCSNLAIKLNQPLHMHFCEDLNEVRGINEKYKVTPAKAIEDIGLLRNKLILAHCTFLTDEDLDILKKGDVSIVHNPLSNLNLGCGIADIKKYSKYVNVCLGTDGQGSGNNMNLFYHMSLVDLLQKGSYKDPTVMSSYDVLKMATVNGAQALGYNDIGSIKIGNKADIIILDMNDIDVYPSVNVINNIVHNGFGSVSTTIIDGEILYENKKLKLDIDIDLLRNKIDNIINRLSR